MQFVRVSVLLSPLQFVPAEPPEPGETITTEGGVDLTTEGGVELTTES